MHHRAALCSNEDINSGPGGASWHRRPRSSALYSVKLCVVSLFHAGKALRLEFSTVSPYRCKSLDSVKSRLSLFKLGTVQGSGLLSINENLELQYLYSWEHRITISISKMLMDTRKLSK